MAGSVKKADGSEGLKMMLPFLQQVGVNVYAGTNFDRHAAPTQRP